MVKLTNDNSCGHRCKEYIRCNNCKYLVNTSKNTISRKSSLVIFFTSIKNKINDFIGIYSPRR